MGLKMVTDALLSSSGKRLRGRTEGNLSNGKSKLTEEIRVTLEPPTSWTTAMRGLDSGRFLMVFPVNGTESSGISTACSKSFEDYGGVCLCRERDDYLR